MVGFKFLEEVIRKEACVDYGVVIVDFA